MDVQNQTNQPQWPHARHFISCLQPEYVQNCMRTLDDRFGSAPNLETPKTMLFIDHMLTSDAQTCFKPFDFDVKV